MCARCLNFTDKNKHFAVESIVFSSPPEIPFELSVSSNYDWFSNNPRYSVKDVEEWMSNLKNSLKLINLYSDDASVAVVAQKTN